MKIRRALDGRSVVVFEEEGELPGSAVVLYLNYNLFDFGLTNVLVF